MRLMPPDYNLNKLRDDYEHMQNMIFGEKIPFDTILDGIAKLEKERVRWGELLPVLGASVPQDCWLTTIKQRDASQVVELQGKAKEIEQIKNLIDNLEVTKNFSKVTLVETNAIKGELIGYKIILYGKGKGE